MSILLKPGEVNAAKPNQRERGGARKQKATITISGDRDSETVTFKMRFDPPLPKVPDAAGPTSVEILACRILEAATEWSATK